MKKYFLRLITFNQWANYRLADMMLQSAQVTDDALLLYNHVGQAGDVWLSRLKGQQSRPSVWEVHPLDEASKLLIFNSEQWLDYIKAKDDDFSHFLDYANTQGTYFINVEMDIIAHVVNHNTYHRGQIIKMIKPYLDKITSTDLITFARENPIA